MCDFPDWYWLDVFPQVAEITIQMLQLIKQSATFKYHFLKYESRQMSPETYQLDLHERKKRKNQM